MIHEHTPTCLVLFTISDWIKELLECICCNNNYKMIDVSQWRASIGLWNYCQPASSRPANGRHSHSFKAAVDSKSGSTTSGENTSKLPAALSLIAFLLLLFLSLSLLRHILMIPPTGKQQLQLCTCIFTGILLLGNCYQVQCTTGVTVTDTNYLQSVVLPGGSSSILIYNDLYLIVCLRMLLLLSGDVELNPGPMIDDRPDISLLIQWLEPLVDWKPFGCCLGGITYLDISKIEAENKKIDEKKLALYSKWLSVAPKATWADVINALRRRRENKLVQDIMRYLQKKSLKLGRSCVTTSSQKKTIMFRTAEDEREILQTLIRLKKEFPILIMHVRSALQTKSENDSRLLGNLIIWLEAYMHWNDKLTNASLDEIFKIIYPFYDFIDCSLIVDMSEVFLRDFKFRDDELHVSIVSEFNKYKKTADTLRFSAQVKHLNESLQTIYEEHIPDTSNMPMISMKLHNPWHDSNINGLSLLIHNLLPVGHQQSIMKYITITSGSVIIKYSVYGSTADSLIEYTGGKLQFMRLIGIFSLYINDHPVLQEDENTNFTFELALLEAVTAGNNEAVEFLLQLETVNTDHTNEEGEKALRLMLACERGHEDIVHSLLSAGANVNIQDNKGWTALMIASEHNHISIIHMLLQANANPHLKISDGSNAVMIASYYGNYEVVKLLISKGVDYKYQREDGWNAFMSACQNGHTQVVELLLKEQVDPNVQNKDGWNAFMIACQNGHTQIVELLLKEQVDPNVQRNSGGNAFMSACQNGHTQIVELLLKEQVDPNVQEEDGVNAFMSACQNGHTQIVELLLKEQVDPNVQEEDGVNAFMSACQNGHTQIVELLLKEQVDPNVQRNSGGNAFMSACQNGQTQIVELLLKEQVDPNVQKEDGVNAFMSACQNGHTQIVELLLKEQVDPNVQRNSGGNAFMSACQNGHSQIVELLLKEQVDPNVQREDGVNAFMLVCQNGHTQIFKLLLKEQVDPNVQDKDGWNAFMLACQNGHTQIVELLLKEQVDPNVQDKDGWNAFMLACQNGHTQVVKLLLKEQVDSNVQLKNGWNAFMLACENGHTQIVELLLKEQVDHNVQKEDGVNAFMLACQNGHTQIVELLLKEQVDPNVQEKDGWNAFMLACQNGHTQIVELLLKEQVDPNVQEKDGWNAFMLACQNGHTQIVELLLKEQVDPNVQEKDGWNAFMLACQNGHTQIVELLLKEQVDPNVQDKIGVNALMLASANGHYEVVKLLLEWKADPTIKSNKGNTAISVAESEEIHVSALIKKYLKKGNIIFKEDATSVYSFATVSSGYHTSSDINSMITFPSTLTLDSVIGDFTNSDLK